MKRKHKLDNQLSVCSLYFTQAQHQQGLSFKQHYDSDSNLSQSQESQRFNQQQINQMIEGLQSQRSMNEHSIHGGSQAQNYLKDYRDRLFNEEMMRQKTFFELEKLEQDYRLLEKERDSFKIQLIEKDKEYHSLKRKYQTQKQQMLQSTTPNKMQMSNFNSNIQDSQRQDKNFDRKMSNATPLITPTKNNINSSTINHNQNNLSESQNQCNNLNKSKENSQGVFDTLNDSVLSDLRHELCTAKKLTGNEKEQMLVEIQDKLDELVNSTRPYIEYLSKFSDISLQNQHLQINLKHTEGQLNNVKTELYQMNQNNQKLEEDRRVLKLLNKELKKEKRHFENEALKEKVRVNQLQDIIKMLGINTNQQENIQPQKQQQEFNDLNQFSFDEQNWMDNLEKPLVNESERQIYSNQFEIQTLNAPEVLLENQHSKNTVTIQGIAPSNFSSPTMNDQQPQNSTNDKNQNEIINNQKNSNIAFTSCENSNNNQQQYDTLLMQVIEKLDNLQQSTNLMQQQKQDQQKKVLPSSRKNLNQIFSPDGAQSPPLLHLKPTDTTQTSFLQMKPGIKSPINLDLSEIQHDLSSSNFRIDMSNLNIIEPQKGPARQMTYDLGHRDFFENFANVNYQRVQRPRQDSAIEINNQQIMNLKLLQNQSDKPKASVVILENNQQQRRDAESITKRSLQGNSKRSSGNESNKNSEKSSHQNHSHNNPIKSQFTHGIGYQGNIGGNNNQKKDNNISKSGNSHHMNNNLIMRESIIGNFLIDQANNMKESSQKDDSFSDFNNEAIQTRDSRKSEKRVSFKKESKTPGLQSIKMFPQLFMGTPTLLNAYFQKKQKESMFLLEQSQHQSDRQK
ncbi:UNKNOWN [Stylonychia lemnae]|uniref:Uncharacterized protein n=1 Tax=Stylonychia lemnae TaxID=5949 RepID=A0A078AUS9_STYLE|nr:UNKNOWN [Stylonychia lemnae]|eukprot:CDW86155.1 UNKNOWN [Stylonychia lemnae]